MDRAAVREQTDRILQSRTFTGKTQLAKLLEVLFDNMDSQSTLKPDRVIRELWPDELKTKRSADVATEMNRLRKALESYYSGEGAADPVIITLPNRSVAAGNGAKEKRWIAAVPRDSEQTELPSAGISRIRLLLAAIAIVVVGVITFYVIRKLSGADPPQSARVEESSLVVMNGRGQELWRKSFADGLQPKYYNQGSAARVWIGDLDGDGRPEVLFLHYPGGAWMSHSTTLICYSDLGKEKWRWEPGKDLPELEGNPATYEIAALRVLKATPTRGPRIVVSSYHLPYYPNQIAIIDAQGKTLSEYWHSGHLEFLTLADLDGDGREEIIATGINNGYRQATLVVLDPDHISGASTELARPEVQIHGMGAAPEKVRLLFPRSDLNKIVATFNEAQEATVEHGKIRVAVLECHQREGCLVWYEFDKNFNLIMAEEDDYFRSYHNEFFLNTKSNHSFSPEESASFRQIRCLVGCSAEFVAVQAR
jgi:hypothetical protein